MTEIEALRAARLTAQRLAGPPCHTVAEATRHLLAIQAQDPRGARLALRVRTKDAHVEAVDRALTEERSLVVTWLGRGTLHLVAAEDEAFLHQLTTPPLRTGNERRLAQEGVSPSSADRAVETIVGALSADGPLTRRELRERLDRADLPTAGQALVHTLVRATLDGHIIRGPMRGSEQAFALREEWLGPRGRVDRDVALTELARRYLRGHAPADDRDLARWAGLPLRDARAGLAAIANELVEWPGGLLTLRRREPPAPVPRVRLLGPFDPLLLGWRSRDFVLGGAPDVVTANGIFRAVVLLDGRAAGTWTIPGGRVTPRLWAPERADRALAAEIDHEAAAVARFLTGR